MLFSDQQHPTGSLRDFYRQTSGGKVLITGSVHSWLRMANPYEFYTGNASGTNPHSYPGNAQGLCEEAVREAKRAGILFPPDLDLFGDGNVTALFVVHAGLGAETLPSPQNKREIWSHKWFMPNPVPVLRLNSIRPTWRLSGTLGWQRVVDETALSAWRRCVIQLPAAILGDATRGRQESVGGKARWWGCEVERRR